MMSGLWGGFCWRPSDLPHARRTGRVEFMDRQGQKKETKRLDFPTDAIYGNITKGKEQKTTRPARLRYSIDATLLLYHHIARKSWPYPVVTRSLFGLRLRDRLGRAA